MFANISWGALGLGYSFDEGAAVAARVGFASVDTPVGAIRDPAAFTAELQSFGLQPGPWGLPTRWQGSQADFDADLPELERQAAIAEAVGATRCSTWVPAWSDTRAFDANWEFHLQRFRPIAQILGAHHIALGLEFIGPKTSRAAYPYEFISTCPEMIKLCRAIGANVGLLLDAWHWYTSGGTLVDLEALVDFDVVQVHVNDAPAGVPVDEQKDNVRCLPGDTGVIDLAGFMAQLARMDYSGPLTVEPFYTGLASMPPLAAVYRVKATLDYLFDLAG